MERMTMSSHVGLPIPSEPSTSQFLPQKDSEHRIGGKSAWYICVSKNIICY
jgi:hypothetical protein